MIASKVMRMLIVGLLCVWGLAVARVARAQEHFPLSPIATAQPQFIEIASSLQPSDGEIHGIVSLTPLALDGCFGIPGRPVDMMVLIDTSPSAGIPTPGSNFGRSQEILKSLWAQMNQMVCYGERAETCEPSRLGIVTVDPGVRNIEVNMRLPLTYTTTAIETAIDHLQNGADSGFDVGVEATAQMLKKTGRSSAAHAIVLLLHDSFFLSQSSVSEAINRASKHAQIFVIGNTLNIREAEQVTEELARQIAGISDVVIDPSPEELRRLFLKASGSEPGVLGRNIWVSVELSSEGEVEVVDAAGGEVAENKIQWYIPTLYEHPKELQFQLRVPIESTTAQEKIRVSVTMTGIDCNGFRFSLSNLTEKEVNISGPGVLPTATDTPLASTVSPTVSPTPAFVLSPSEEPAKSSKEWLMVLFIIPMLFIIGLLWYIWRHGQRVKPSPYPKLEAKVRPIKRANVERLATSKGKTIKPGRFEENVLLLERLRSAQEIIGRIPTQLRGPHRSRVLVCICTSVNDLKKGDSIHVEMMGSHFLWENGETREVPVALLQRILSERVSIHTPIIAVWTKEPTDNIAFSVSVKKDPASKVIKIQITSTYNPTRSDTSTRSYWFYIKFIENPGWYIILQPLIDN